MRLKWLANGFLGLVDDDFETILMEWHRDELPGLSGTEITPLFSANSTPLSCIELLCFVEGMKCSVGVPVLA